MALVPQVPREPPRAGPFPPPAPSPPSWSCRAGCWEAWPVRWALLAGRPHCPSRRWKRRVGPRGAGWSRSACVRTAQREMAWRVPAAPEPGPLHVPLGFRLLRLHLLFGTVHPHGPPDPAPPGVSTPAWHCHSGWEDRPGSVLPPPPQDQRDRISWPGWCGREVVRGDVAAGGDQALRPAHSRLVDQAESPGLCPGAAPALRKGHFFVICSALPVGWLESRGPHPPRRQGLGASILVSILPAR